MTGTRTHTLMTNSPELESDALNHSAMTPYIVLYYPKNWKIIIIITSHNFLLETKKEVFGVTSCFKEML